MQCVAIDFLMLLNTGKAFYNTVFPLVCLLKSLPGNKKKKLPYSLFRGDKKMKEKTKTSQRFIAFVLLGGIGLTQVNGPWLGPLF